MATLQQIVRRLRDPLVYPDTNAVRYLGAAFRERQLPDALQGRIAASLISMTEILSQLATPGGEDVLRQIRAMINWLPDQVLALPWPDTFLAVHVFDLPMPTDDRFDAIANGCSVCMHATNLDQVREQAMVLRAFLKQGQLDTAQMRSEAVARLRPHRRTGTSAQITEALVEALRQRVGAPPGRTANDAAGKLEAFLTFERINLRTALDDKDYNFLSADRLNDQFDADQLMYLAYPNLRFLTADRGFRRAANCAQGSRIHIVQPCDLQDADSAIRTLERVLA